MKLGITSDQDFINRCNKLLRKLDEMPKLWESPLDKVEREIRIAQRQLDELHRLHNTEGVEKLTLKLAKLEREISET